MYKDIAPEDIKQESKMSKMPCFGVKYCPESCVMRMEGRCLDYPIKQEGKMHTKGKWEALREDNHFAIRSADDLCPIAETRHATAIDKANAHLIAAAHELCEALKSAKTILLNIQSRHISNSFHNNRVHSDAGEAVKFIDQALAEAGGKGE